MAPGGRDQEATMPRSIASNARINDLLHVLSDPVEYLTGVAENFVRHGYDPETSAIRIGTMGEGPHPNYKIEKPSAPVTFNVKGRPFTVTATPSHTFNGRNHREMRELDDCERHSEHWSSETITLAELQALRANLPQSGPTCCA
jgi:hypothetical protein